jgi:ATP-binding cassette subfamily F protein uup
VTHDRYLFERVTTTVLALDGTGTVTPFADYRQWEAARRARSTAPQAPSVPRPPRAAVKRLSYTEQREWEGIESAILEAEARRDACALAVHDPAVATDAAALAARYQALQDAHVAVDRLYARWAELDAKRSG